MFGTSLTLPSDSMIAFIYDHSYIFELEPLRVPLFIGARGKGSYPALVSVLWSSYRRKVDGNLELRAFASVV
jgi:hypothetical protein